MPPLRVRTYGFVVVVIIPHPTRVCQGFGREFGGIWGELRVGVGAHDAGEGVEEEFELRERKFGYGVRGYTSAEGERVESCPVGFVRYSFFSGSVTNPEASRISCRSWTAGAF
jgi:hypothetical protein